MTGKKILLVEDDLITVKIIKQLLDLTGYQCSGVADSAEACLLSIKENRPDLVLMDISLQGKHDGIYAANKVRELYSIPVIFLTATEEEHVLEKAKHSQPYGYLIKPVNHRDLNSTIEIALYKHEVEQNLRIEHEKLETVTNSVGIGLATISTDYKVTWANDVLKKMFGEVENKKCYEFLNCGTVEVCKNCGVKEIFNKKTETHIHEHSTKDISGKKIWLEIIASPITDKNKKVLQALEVVVPVTEKKKLEAKLRETKQIRALASHLETVREEEKINIAREIHDELGQALTALKFDVSWLNKKLSGFEKQVPDTVIEKFRSMSSLIDSTMKTIRKIASDLRPGILDDIGLTASIEWQISEFEKRTGIKCNSKIEVNKLEFSKTKKTAFYRIFQEIMTNIVRHSKATKVSVWLKETPKNITLKVNDNGIGISVSKIKAAKSFGITGMKERALLLGGSLKISGSKKEGTTITVKIPKNELNN